MQKKLQKLGLNPDNSIVIGSGILQALNIRKSNDIDLVVSSKDYTRLKKTGKILKTDNIEIATIWQVSGKKYYFKNLAENSTVINNVRYITLDFLYKTKKSWITNGTARPKDLKDIKLIEKYFATKTFAFRKQQRGFNHKPEDYIWMDFAKWFKQKK